MGKELAPDFWPRGQAGGRKYAAMVQAPHGWAMLEALGLFGGGVEAPRTPEQVRVFNSLEEVLPAGWTTTPSSTAPIVEDDAADIQAIVDAVLDPYRLPDGRLTWGGAGTGLIDQLARKTDPAVALRRRFGGSSLFWAELVRGSDYERAALGFRTSGGLYMRRWTTAPDGPYRRNVALPPGIHHPGAFTYTIRIPLPAIEATADTVADPTRVIKRERPAVLPQTAGRSLFDRPNATGTDVQQPTQRKGSRSSQTCLTHEMRMHARSQSHQVDGFPLTFAGDDRPCVPLRTAHL